jgi:tetratricopeptide (TPR) repeat protein
MTVRRWLTAVLIAAGLAACTPKSALLMSALPDGALSVLLGHLERVDDTNRKQIVEFERRGDWQGMAKFAEDNLARGGPIAEWWLIAGYAHTQLGNHARAAECYNEAVQLAPDDIFAWQLLAQSYRAAGRSERAIVTLERILLVRRDVPTAYLLLGESYSDLAQWRQALQAYRQALALDDTLAEAWFGAGRAHARLGQTREAAEMQRRLEPGHPALAAALAREIGQR